MIDVVIVTYNSETYLPRLASDLALSTRIASVTIVDNRSSDGSVALARRLEWGAPSAVISMSGNVGFGAAVNRGSLARASPVGQLLIINPDVSVDPRTLAALSDDLENDGRLAVVGTALNTKESVPVSSARHFPTLRSIAARSSVNVIHGDRLVKADWICGALMLWRRTAFVELDGFSPDYFLYYEDVDICKRAWKGGWAVAIDGRRGAIHDQGHGRKTSRALVKMSRKSRRTYAVKWHGLRGVVVAAVADLIDLAADFYHLIRGA